MLYTLRTDKGLSRYQLGKLVGVIDKAVSKWKNDSNMPQLSILKRFAEILEFSVETLLGSQPENDEAGAER